MPMPAEIRHEIALDVNEYAISELATALANWLVDPLFKDLGAVLSNHTEDLLPILYAVGHHALVCGYEAGIEDQAADALELTAVSSALLDQRGNQYTTNVPESIAAEESEDEAGDRELTAGN